MYGAFAFDLETTNVENQHYCEPDAAGVSHLNRLYECFNGDATETELQIERKHVHVFDRENNNQVMDMTAYVIENYEGKPKNVTDKYDRRKISLYKYQFVGHNASGLDKYILLNSLPKTYAHIKLMKTSRGLIKLSFKAGSAFEGDREIPITSTLFFENFV